MKLYFIRHGETTYSKVGGYCGNLDPDLTEDGMKMAQQFANTYATLGWEAVYVSPMTRTQATARPICKATGITPQLRDGLREIAYGKWEGMSPDEVNEKFHDDYIRWLTDPGWNAPIGGERGVDLARRSSDVLREIQERHDSGNVLVVSHKATIRVMLCSLLGIDVGRFRDRIAMPVGGVSIIEFRTPGPLVHAIADRAYLDDELCTRPGT